jgi:sugar O-acyltransferase (sialic acid O-acetyltransferase NeuD family)
MKQIVLFGVGSALMVDVEESCRRSSIDVVAAVRNMDGPVYVSDALRLVTPAELTKVDLAYPVALVMMTPANRKLALEEAFQLGFTRLATIVDPTSPLALSTRVGEGVYVNAGCVIGGGGTIGDLVVINRGANIGHHVAIGQYATIGPGAVIAGAARVGRGAFIGAGAVVLPEVEVGDNAVVGAGAVVTRSVASNTMVVGNPARVIKSEIAGYRGRPV